MSDVGPRLSNHQFFSTRHSPPDDVLGQRQSAIENQRCNAAELGVPSIAFFTCWHSRTSKRLYVRAEADWLAEAGIGGAMIVWAGLTGWVGKRMVEWVALGKVRLRRIWLR